MAQAPGRHGLPRSGAAHKPASRHKPKAQEDRGSARERGYTAEWERFRLQQLRLQPLCEYCMADGRVVPATVLDHDLPHEGDPDLFWRNTFTSLCKRHHDGEKQRAEARFSGDALLAWVRKRKGQGG